MIRWEWTKGKGCGHDEAKGIVDNFFHDLQCWGWSTAWYNLKWLLRNG